MRTSIPLSNVKDTSALSRRTFMLGAIASGLTVAAADAAWRRRRVPCR